MSTQQKQQLAFKCLREVVKYRTDELDMYLCILKTFVKCTHLSFLSIGVGKFCFFESWYSLLYLNVRADIIENSLFILCKHLEYYYLYCIPSDREVSTLQTSLSGRTKPRRLQGNCSIFYSAYLLLNQGLVWTCDVLEALTGTTATHANLFTILQILIHMMTNSQVITVSCKVNSTLV